ncbi:MAG: Hydroxymethylpyrimidine ABC transporter, transmembrane component [Brockia lithotrophica]|uniref:Hydroxymethylpyrimidine ABC transporter, transmembrane component n=1 Tax=Brockia lithotrophica TaxID=933949 RepID=A0A2T5G791_9BACL|nr:MAG: Hydroxymethylpyrimidine ABC transporter, transmembrane component [Brockia lithotrophica]
MKETDVFSAAQEFEATDGGKDAWLEEARRAYIRKDERRAQVVRFLQVGIVLALLAGWELGARWGALDPLLFSSPTAVAQLVADLAASGELWRHVGITVYETLLGFALGTLGGVLVALALWFFPLLGRVLDPYLVVLNSLPKIALGPIFIVAFGSGPRAIVAIAAFVSIFVTIQVLTSAFAGVDANFLRLAYSLGASRLDVFRKIVFPASLSTLLAALKVNIGLAWIGVIVGEFLVARQGLGALIVYGFQVFNFRYVYAGILLVALLATAMYALASAAERMCGRGPR